ncbi:MAG: ABC transporter substrate-binding protein [Actinomycetota bacterium]|jgi:branched-chain amino acid transport system substrate-binding protein|nr:ABC transporter substrate-binding protein [Actinomycetota bacterium]
MPIRHHTPRRLAAGLALLLLAPVAAACSSTSSTASSTASSTSGGSVTVGESTTLSSSIAELGQTALQGLELAVANINAHGGLLGKKVKVVSADDSATPATGASNERSMILNDHVVAMFGPVVSSVASAEEPIAAQYHIPIFFSVSNDIALMTSGFTKYGFQLVPNTVMEPRAAAAYLAHEAGSTQITVGTFAPNYSFGTSSVAGFIQALKDLHVNYKLVSQQFPPLNATNIAPYLSALIAAHPEYVYNAQFGGDLVSFTQQANQYGFFQHTKMIAMYSAQPLEALGSSAPAGAIGFDRAPFWLAGQQGMDGPGISAFISQFKAKYGDYPSAWAIMTYTAAQSWAYGVKKAGTFNGTSVSNALSGATISTIRGPITLRACDHQANVPEYVGVVSSTVDPTYRLRLWDPSSVFIAQPKTIMLTCAQSLALRS